jgi:Na+/H+-dicarboxylate symporter
VLLDQGVQGQIASINTEQATVKYWEPKSTQNIYFLRSAKGIDIPFRHENERLTIAEPVPVTEGQGVEIRLPENIQISQSDNGSVMTTLKEVLVGNRQQEKEGLVPRNIFNAMVKMDILPLIFFSLLLGAAITVLGQKGKLLIEVANVLNDAIMQIVQWIMYFAPFGIFGLIGARIGQEGGFSGFIPELVALGKYSFTILFGLTLHGVIVLPLILYLFARRSPLSYAKGMAPALLNAFSTASSSATLPLTMEGVEKENGISNRTASFVLPLGATVNMDGTALYEAVAAMFIAQIYGITMSPVHQLLIFLTATLAAIGAAGIPQAGLVTMIIVLKAVNLPIEGIGIILTIDWLLDRFRTTVNVWGDSIGAGVVEALELRHQ